MKATVITFSFFFLSSLVLFWCMSHGPLWNILLYPVYYVLFNAMIFAGCAIHGMFSNT